MLPLFDITTLEQKALDLRISANIDGEYPVPVDKVAEHLGYQCFAFRPNEATKDVSGAVNHKTKSIYVNDMESNARRRFTCAHEIGHILLDAGKENHIDYRIFSTEKNIKEQKANQFAGSLLMPEDVFRLKKKELNGAFEKLASFFGVSEDSVIVRDNILEKVASERRSHFRAD